MKCKFCGKDLLEQYHEYDSYSFCTCNKSKEYLSLKNEIKSMERELNRKKMRLSNLELEGVYGTLYKQKSNLETEMREYSTPDYHKEDRNETP